MGRGHLDAVLGSDDLADRTFGLGHRVDTDILLLKPLASLKHFGSGAGFRGCQDDRFLGHSLVTEHIPLGGVN